MFKEVVSEVKFYPLRPTDKGLIGIASCLFDNNLSLNCISVYLKPSGEIRLLFPNKQLPNARDINIYFPVNRECYELIKIAIEDKIKKLNEKVNGEQLYGKFAE